LVKSSTEMTTVSTVRKLSILGRIVMQQAGRTRTVNALLQAGRSTALNVGRILHLLWLQVTGFVFLCIALIAGLAFRHEYYKYQAGGMGPGKVWLAAGVTLMFLWFGLSSFWRAGRKR
jgi:hypothetical protein